MVIKLHDYQGTAQPNNEGQKLAVKVIGGLLEKAQAVIEGGAVDHQHAEYQQPGDSQEQPIIKLEAQSGPNAVTIFTDDVYGCHDDCYCP
jgi:hypothetical protein